MIVINNSFLIVYSSQVVEEMESNITVGTVLATDKDSGKNSEIRYSIIGEHANELFFMEQASGNIKTRVKIDREVESKLEFLVIAYDGGIPQLSGSTHVLITVEDINDNAVIADDSSISLVYNCCSLQTSLFCSHSHSLTKASTLSRSQKRLSHRWKSSR